MNNPTYCWNPEAGYAKCILYYKDLEFIGESHCHIEDRDMMSKLMGQNIAETRATLKILRFIRDHELRPQLNILNQLYYNMKNSKKFNNKSYEAKMLYKQIHLVEKNLNLVKEELNNVKSMLYRYIEQKEQEHKKLRNVISGRK